MANVGILRMKAIKNIIYTNCFVSFVFEKANNLIGDMHIVQNYKCHTASVMVCPETRIFCKFKAIYNIFFFQFWMIFEGFFKTHFG